MTETEKAKEALEREFNATEFFQKRVGQYVKVRDALREMEDAHKENVKPFVEVQNELTAWFMEHLEKCGATSVKTTEGTVYSSTRYSASLEDPKAFMDYVIANNAWDLLDRKANATAVRDFVETNHSPPPGAKLSAIRTVGVRRATDK